jgi:Flp pilus assembly protein CpaB
MKPKTMILMVVAVACGLGASYMTSRLLADRGIADETDTVRVLVARRNLDTGFAIKDPQAVFEEKAYIRGEEPKSAILNYDEIKGRMLKRSLREGDFISGLDLLSERESLMAYMIPEGYRAIGLRVNLENIAGGFASLPFSRVDIVATVKRGDDKSSFSQVLLQNVLVLAVDQRNDRDEAGRAMPGSVVTVALSPEEVLKANIAKEYGPLSLVLRKFNDQQKVEVSKVTFDDIITNGKSGDVTDRVVGPETKPEKPEPKLDPKGRIHVVTVINGDRQEQVEYTLDESDQVISSRLVPREGFPAAPPAPPAPAPKVQGKEEVP